MKQKLWDIFDIGDGKLQVQREDNPLDGSGPLEDDYAAIVLARQAGVICDDEGNII